MSAVDLEINMSVGELLRELKQQKVQLGSKDGKLSIKAPAGVIDHEMKRVLKHHKSALIALLDTGRDANTLQLAMAAVARDKPLPLSFSQQRLLLLHQLDPQSEAYNVASAFELKGTLNRRALQATLDALLHRHEVLRTAYTSDKNEPQQNIFPPSSILLEEYEGNDAENIVENNTENNAENNGEVHEWLEAGANRPFDLMNEGPIRVRLIRVNDKHHVLQWVIHHIAVDAWSMGLMVKEFLHLYPLAIEHGNTFSTEQLAQTLGLQPLQYADFAHWQRHNLKGDSLQTHMDYWCQALGRAPVVLELPTDFTRPPVQTHNGARIKLTLDPDLSSAIEGLNARVDEEQISPFVLLLGCYQKLLHEYAGQDDIRVGVPNANRHNYQTQTMVGCFINTLVMRAQFDSKQSVADFFQQQKALSHAAQDHQSLPFEMLVDELSVGRDMSRSPLFQAMFNFLQRETGLESTLETQLETLTIKPLDVTKHHAQFELSLTVQHEQGQNFVCQFEYNTDLFSAERIENMARHYNILLKRLVNALQEKPRQALHSIGVLDERDQQQQLFDWNASQRDFDLSQDMVTRFERQAEYTPETIAVQFGSSGINYRDLNHLANQLAHYFLDLDLLGKDLLGQKLSGQDVGCNGLIALNLDRDIHMLACMLAVQKAGFAYLPIDPTYPQARQQYILDHAEPIFTLTPTVLAGILPHLNTYPKTNLFFERASEQLAYTLYTSGSTGNPKGVQISHGSFINFLLAMAEHVPLMPKQRWLAITTIAFDISGLELFLPLISGATVVLASREEAQDPQQLLALLEQDINIMQATPATWHMLLEHSLLENSLLKNKEVPWFGLHALCGGEALSMELANQLLARKVTLLNLYGPTETTVWSTCQPITKHLDKAASIGKPLANNQCFVLNNQRHLVPVGTPGELYIGGQGLAMGYLKREDLSEKAFIENPFFQMDKSFSQRLYRTGDRVCYRPDGSLEYLGRNDFQVKIRGFRIELGDIEQHLSQHPDVIQTVVNATDDERDMKCLVAYVVTHSDFERSDSQDSLRDGLRVYLLQKLPEYMVPELFVVLENLPLTDNGKVNRKALPVPDLAQMQVSYIAPINAFQETLCDLYQQILGLEQVGVQDNFFLLGGHSLLATRLIAQVNQHFSVNLPLKTLFTEQTPSAMAKVVERVKFQSKGQDLKDDQCLDGTARTAIVKVSRTEDLLPSFAQQRLWLLDQIDNGSTHYHLPGVVTLEGELNFEALNYAFNAIVERHESLRTRFFERDGQPLQKIQNHKTITVPLVDLTVKPTPLDVRNVGNVNSSYESDNANREQITARINERFICQPFDLKEDVFLRTQVLKVSEGQHLLVVVLHHIAADGWSMAIVIREFEAFYRAYINQSVAVLPELTVQYADYAQWQRQGLQGEVINGQLDYWEAQLADLPVVHNLSLDYPRPLIQTFNGALHRSDISTNILNSLQGLCLKQGATLFMGLHAAFSVLLARYSNEHDIVVGTPIANREQAEVADLIGFFVNTLVLRSDLSSEPNFNELLTQSKMTLLDSYDHQQAPFEQLVDRLQPERSTAHGPLYQVMLSLQNNEKIQASLPELTLEMIEPVSAIAKCDLTLEVSESEQGLSLSWEYNTDLFKADTIAQMAAHFEQLVAELTTNPQQNVFTVAMLNEQERKQELEQWNITATDFPAQQCIHEVFELQVERTPGTTAVVFEKLSVSYAQLNTQANQLAHYLVETVGLQPDQRVGICMQRSISMVVAILATLKAGGAYVPLDPDLPSKRIEQLCSDADLKITLSQESLQQQLSIANDKILYVDNQIFQQSLKTFSTQNIDVIQLGLTSKHLAYVIYTSGSTGMPKGVMVEHQALMNRIDWMDKEYGSSINDRFLQKTPFNFDVSIWEFVWPLVTGARLILAAPEGHKDPNYLSELIQSEGITKAHFVPSMLANMLSYGNLSHCQSLQQVFCSGEALGLHHVVELQNQCPWLHIHNLYGPTEAAIDVSYWACPERVADHKELRSIPIGRPIQNIQLYVLDSQLEPVVQGVVGELYIGGIGLARGYLNRVDLTQAAFIPNPFYQKGNTASSERLYKTGDLVRRLNDGNLDYIGRSDFQVKLRGLRIELGEIEHALDQLEEVSESSVLVANEAEQQQLVAYIVADFSAGLANDLDNKISLDERRLVSSIRKKLDKALPSYMVPTAFVVLPAMPLTSNGKLDRKALPAPDIALQQKEYVEPSNAIETELCSIWQQVLGLKQVGINDNFFSLGGHSLLVIQVLARAKEKGFNLTAHQLYTSPDVQSLAQLVVQNEAQIEGNKDTFVLNFNVPANLIPEDCNKLEPSMLPLVDISEQELEKLIQAVPGGAQNIQDVYPLTPLQEGIFFHHLMSSDSDPYVLPNLLSLPNRQALDHLIEALEFMLTRHDVLRTAFHWEGLETPVQVVYRNASLPVQWLEITPQGKDLETQMRWHTEPEQQLMDLTKAPLLGLKVAKDKDSERHLVILQFHHLISDHEGLDIIQRELALWQQGLAGTLTQPIPYRNFVAHALHANKQLDADGFFRTLLGDIETPVLPFNLQNVRGDGRQVKEVSATVDDLTAVKIRTFSQQLNLSPASIFHLAWGMVVGACSGQHDVVFGTVLSGRLQGNEGAENTLGVFMNTLPVRLNVQNNNVREQVLDMHKQLCDLLPFEQCSLVQATRCSGVPAETPLFSALLNYRHSSGVNSGAEPPPEIHPVADEMVLLDWHERTNYPFNLAVDDLGPKGFALELQIDESVDAQRILNYIQTALTVLTQALSEKPHTSMDTLAVVSLEEQLTACGPVVDYSKVDYVKSDSNKGASVEALFEQQAGLQGNKIAAYFGENSSSHEQLNSLSYKKLNSQANQLANYLIEQGLKPDHTIIICQRRSLSMLVSLLAVLKAGLAYVPIDPSYPRERIKYMLEDADASLVLCDRTTLASRILDQTSRCKVLDVQALAESAELKSQSETAPKHAADEHNLAYMIYTSGSTGKPKGVQITRGNMLNFLRSMQDLLQPTENDKLLAVTSLSFDIAVLELFLPLICGAQVVIADETLALDGQGLKTQLQEQSITMMQATPVSWKILLAAGWQQENAFTVLCGGEAFPGELAEQLLDQRSLNIWNLYGPTETTVWSAAAQLSRDKAQTYSNVPIGEAIANTQIYILDQALKPVPVGVAGELCVGGLGLARGYAGQPELTESRFVNTEYGRLYRTGDLARYREDRDFKRSSQKSLNLECLGRLDHQVKVRGFRIELGEIEACINTHTQVRECVVHAYQHHGESLLVAYVVFDGDDIDLNPHMQQELPNHMLPSTVVALKSLPLTPNGKVDRKALPNPQFKAAQQPYVAPRNDIESKLQKIWQDLLGIEEMGIEDNFFELGGHSLLATRLMMRSQDMFRVKLALADLFHGQTIAAMAELIEKAQSQQSDLLDDSSLSRIEDLLAEFED